MYTQSQKNRHKVSENNNGNAMTRMRASSEIITGVEIEHNGIRMSNKKIITGHHSEQFAMGEANISEGSP